MTANDEVKIRVVLDTKDAQAALNSLGIGGAPGGGVPGGTAAPTANASAAANGLSLGKLFGIGAGLVGAHALASPIVGPTESGIGDIIGESLGGLGARLQNFALGDLPLKAKASEDARKSVEETFAYVAGQNGIPAQARASYEAQFQRNLLREKGIRAFETDNRFRLGGDAEKVDQGVHLVMGSIADGFRAMGDRIVALFKSNR